MRNIRFIAVIVGTLLLSAIPGRAFAADASGFQAGRIIDDSVLTNSVAMSPDDIQAFLNAQVPVCDTWGEQPSELGGGTRLEWAEAHGFSAPFTCLKDYSENGKTAAQIIYDAAQQHRINPQVLLVLLQVQQGLVKDSWPVDYQYKLATGYSCPDTATCDTQYYGLTNQLNLSATLFQSIETNSPNWYSAYSVGDNYIRYNPDPACGGSVITIQNRATLALYDYTPYQPNGAALTAGFGRGDACSSYTNRNFYLYFTEWFGSTFAVAKPEVTLTVNGDKTATAAYGSDVTLKWVSKHADSCAIESLGNQPVSGELSIHRVTKSTTYAVDCTGQGGSVRDTAQLNVLPPTFAYLQETLSAVAVTSSHPRVLQGEIQQVELANRAYTQGDAGKSKKILGDVSASLDRMVREGRLHGADGEYLKQVIQDLTASF